MSKISRFLVFFFLLQSCNLQRKHFDKDIYFDNVEMEHYEVLDTSKVELLIEKSKYEHNKIAKCEALYYVICQGGEKKICNVTCCSKYIGNPSYELSMYYGFAYMNGSVILLPYHCVPSNLFKPSMKKCYVTICSGGIDITCSEFDSTYKFIESRNLFIK